MTMNANHVRDFYRVVMITSLGGETQMGSYDEEYQAKEAADAAARRTDYTDVSFIVKNRAGRVLHDVKRGRGVQ